MARTIPWLHQPRPRPVRVGSAPAATQRRDHAGEKGTPLQLIMAKTLLRNPRTAMRYVKLGGWAVAEVTDLLDTAPPRR